MFSLEGMGQGGGERFFHQLHDTPHPGPIFKSRLLCTVLQYSAGKSLTAVPTSRQLIISAHHFRCGRSVEVGIGPGNIIVQPTAPWNEWRYEVRYCHTYTEANSTMSKTFFPKPGLPPHASESVRFERPYMYVRERRRFGLNSCLVNTRNKPPFFQGAL